MMKKRKLAVLFQCGFEYRSTLLSGLMDTIKKNDLDVVAFTKKCNSKFLMDYFKKYNIRIIELEDHYINATRSYVEMLNISSAKAKYRINNVQNFNYFNEDRELKFSDYLLGNSFVNKIFKFLTFVNNRLHYKNTNLVELFNKEQITDFLLCGYMGSDSIAFSVNAKKAGVNVWLIMNNWKNIYVNNYIPFQPDKIFTWSEGMAVQYWKLNPQIRPENFIVSGNPVFDKFYQYTPFADRKYYEQKYGFERSQPLLIYTMLSPDAYPNELESIYLIKSIIDDLSSDRTYAPFILLRRNPLDDVNMGKRQEADNLVYEENFFDHNDTGPLMIQSEEGEQEWSDLLHYASVVINVASTVTLESLMLGTPVINIEFDGKGEYAESLGRYTNAEFYKELKEHKNVHVCQSAETFKAAIQELLSTHEVSIEIPEVVGIFDGKAKERILNEIKR